MDGLQLFSEIQKGQPRHAGDHSHRSRFRFPTPLRATQQACSASDQPVDKDALI